VISSTPDRTPGHGRAVMTACSKEDHAGSVDVNVGEYHMNVGDPSPESAGGRTAQGGLPTTGVGHETSQVCRYNSRRSASWFETALEAAV
jgi:hypothetical protein